MVRGRVAVRVGVRARVAFSRRAAGLNEVWEGLGLGLGVGVRVRVVFMVGV